MTETGSQQGGRIEDRLASLEADLAHNTAANDAMSSIIDQVTAYIIGLSWHTATFLLSHMVCAVAAT